MNPELAHAEIEMLVGTLDTVRADKRAAYAAAVKLHPRFTLADFGVPQITALIAKLLGGRG